MVRAHDCTKIVYFKCEINSKCLTVLLKNTSISLIKEE